MENLGSILISAILSGIFATIITLWWQNRSEKLRTKHSVFSTLMAYRFKVSHPESVKALNCVQAVFYDVPSVLTAWKEFISAAGRKPYDDQIFTDAHISLLEAIAKDLKCKNICWQDIKSSYYPQGLADQLNEDSVLRKAQIQVAMESIEENKRKAAEREMMQIL